MLKILFAYEDKNKFRNYIFVVAKYYIYANKFSQKDLNLNSFLRMLKGKFQSEKYIAFMNNNITAFLLNGALCIIISTLIRLTESSLLWIFRC